MDPNLHESVTPRQPPCTATEAVTLFSSNTMASATVQAAATIPHVVPAFETIALEPADVASRHCPTAGSTLHGPMVGTTVHPRFATKTALHVTMALLSHHLAA